MKVSECKASIFEPAKFDERWISRYQSHENIASMTSLEIVQKPAWLHHHSRYQWNFSFFLTDHSTHIFHRSIYFKFVSDSYQCYPCWLVVVYQIQPSSVVELQQNSPISHKIPLTTYGHRMIFSPPCLFKHMKNDERVAMLLQCLLDYTQKKMYFCLISLLRNNVSKSVYINLRHSVVKRKSAEGLNNEII